MEGGEAAASWIMNVMKNERTCGIAHRWEKVGDQGDLTPSGYMGIHSVKRQRKAPRRSVYSGAVWAFACLDLGRFGLFAL